MRVLFSILVLMLFILGITLDQPVLFTVAGVLLLIILGSFVWMWQRRQNERRRDRRRSSEEEEDEEELRDLGIMEIRPSASGEEEAAIAEEQPDESVAVEEDDAPDEEPLGDLPPEPPDAERGAAAPPPAESPAPAEAEETLTEVETPEPGHSRAKKDDEHRDEEEPVVPEPPASEEAAETQAAHDRDALTPLLRSLQAAVDAQTVALLKQEDLALEYEVVALVSARDDARPADEIFSTNTPLLTAGMTQRDVTVQRVGEMALPLESLGYYTDPADVRQVMIAPMKWPSEPTSYFLLADTEREGGFNADPPRALIARYSDLMATLLVRDEAEPAEAVADTRPRSEIINEEMSAARAEDRPLSLALVYLNRAEALSDEGENAVASAERTLRKRLEKAAGKGRVERFGELTYGVFYPAYGEEAEAWAMQTQSDLEEERGRLEGGVSVGVAVLSERHESPGLLRQDATEALREAYTTGTCTILE